MSYVQLNQAGTAILCPVLRLASAALKSWRLSLVLILLAGMTPVNESKAEDFSTPLFPKGATDLSLEQLVNIQVDSVFGASKYEQKVTRAPASVNIVTSDEIKKFGYRTLADILSSTAGFYITDRRDYSRIGIRGSGDAETGVLLLVDGHRINDALLNAMNVSSGSIVDVDMIERVEIIRGSSSSIYGNSAFFGVINIITKQAKNIDGVEASVEGGSFGAYKGSFTYGKIFTNDLALTFSGTYSSTDGQTKLFYPEFASPGNNNGFALNSDNEFDYHLFGSLAYHDFIFEAAYSGREKRVPTASYGTIFNDGKLLLDEDRGFAELKYEHQFENDFSVMGLVSYDRFDTTGNYPYVNALPPPDVTINRDVIGGQWLRSELQLTKTFFERHTLVVGAEYQKNLRLDLENFDEDPYASYVNIHSGGQTYALYSQAEITLCKPLILNAGVRYDYFYNFGGTVNPRIGLIYSPWEKTTFKALYGQAFRAPNQYQLYYESNTDERNPKLKPETIQTYELVYEQYLPGRLRLSVSGYHYDINGLIAQTTDPANGLHFFGNINQVQANGLELQLEGRYARGLTARASYALQRTEDVGTKQEVSNSPRHLAKFNLSVPLYHDKIFSSVELQYSSSVITLARQRASGFAVVNWTLFSQKLVKGLEMSASIYNLFDTRYSVPGASYNLQDTIQQDGRSFRLKIDYKF